MKTKNLAKLLCFAVFATCFMMSSCVNVSNYETGVSDTLSEVVSDVVLEIPVFDADSLKDSILVIPNKLGDVNGDGAHTAEDYMLIKRAVVGTASLTANALPAADIDGNGYVTVADYLFSRRSAMKTYNIQLPMIPPPDEEIDEVVKAYVDYQNGRFGAERITTSDVVLTADDFCGPYGDGKYYTVYIYHHLQIVLPAVFEFDFNNRMLSFPDSVIPYVWDGEKLYGLEEAYENGFFDDVDLEDLETRYSTAG